MKKLNKLFAMLFGFIMMSGVAFAESGASTALNQEIIGLSKTFGLILFVVIILAFVVVPVAGMFFAKSLAKKKAEQNQEEVGGITSMVWAMGGGIIGFFAVFFVVGFLGSMMNDDGTGKIDLVKGNKHIISAVLGSLLTNTKTSLGGGSSNGGGK